jgi:protein SCO1/2
MKSQEKLLYLLIAAIALFIGQLVYHVKYGKTVSDTTQVYEPARLIKPFTLEDQEQQVFNQENVKGKWSLVFLGYLSCPDICPMTMAKLANLLPKLEASSDDPVQVLFLSVDPQRDTAQRRKEYVNYFHPDIIGLGAEHKDLFPFVRNLGLMYSIPADGEEQYFVDHSASVVLINPDGMIAAIFKPKVEVGMVPTINSKVLLTDFQTLVD